MDKTAKPAVGGVSAAENIRLQVFICEFCSTCMAEADLAVLLSLRYMVVAEEVSIGCFGKFRQRGCNKV